MKVIKHIGTPRHSGRYPWGSGKDGYQRNKSFLGYVKDLEKQGLSEIEIAKGLNITTSELRKKRSIARAEKRASDADLAFKLKEKGYSNVAIGKRMGINESTVRSLLNPILKERANIAFATSEVLKENLAKKPYLDVGLGTEIHLNISRTKLNTALALLKEEGYNVYDVYVKQVSGSGKYTSYKVLAPPGITYKDVLQNQDKIKSISDFYSEDGGRSFYGIEKPKSISKERIFVRYAEDGGKDKDGVIELRRNVEDISLGTANYAQVRVSVDGTHFMKGMAMYSKDIPDGYDIVYNTNKSKGDPKVFKPISDDPDNPFGSAIRQKHYIDSKGNDSLSALNIVGTKEGAGEEGAWEKWSRALSSQVLSKQNPALAKKQLDLTYALKQEEFDEIMSLTNPAVRKALLKPFSDSCDSDAVHLKAAALPRQSSHVLLPFNSIKENEVYAPNFNNGENVVLIRHPHGGIFEIPELIVNNKNREAKEIIGNARDAVGINPKVAARLSGADFDGDSVIVIPNKSGVIKTASPLKGLKDFDPEISYKKVPGMKVMTEADKQHKMGEVSNLITDMTIRGASEDEIARAIRHSMVVIDAVKHEYNYKKSYVDNNIAELKKIYQSTGGASTLISRAKSEVRVPERREGKYVTDPITGKTKRVYIDPETGKKLYTETKATYPVRKYSVDPVTGKKIYYETGKVETRKTISTRMAETDDAFTLSSGTRIESVYASHANKLKSLANKARKAMVDTEDITYSPSARKTYANEVSTLSSKLRIALRNKPLERQAQLLANKVISAKKKSNPDLDKKELKKIKGQTIIETRRRVGAKKDPIQITDREWEAIQAGAISGNHLFQILLNTDLKALKQRAMPRYEKEMSPSRIARAKSMLSEGHTSSEVANALGVTISVLNTAIK